MSSLTDDQQTALSLALEGHNLFIDGRAGTGKTHLLKHICTQLKSLGKGVSVTCTTGIACMNYDADLHASTVHRWSGLHDGRYNSVEVLSIVANNEATMDRLKKTDVLIVDEISMLSKKLFDQLHDICSLKNAKKPWGGIQIIVGGDFNQLPPTPNIDYNDRGDYCFLSEKFDRLHKITLKTVVRQTDKQLASVIHKVSVGGNLSEEDIGYIKELERPLDTCDSIKLFATNSLANSFNRKMIMGASGTICEYVSTDTGDQNKLSRVRAPGKLWLKENCPVILIRNLSPILVNGLRGNVIKCEKDGPIVDFPSINCTMKVQKISFSVFSARQNRTVANREQIPLLLAYALTIHKAQGMTLDSVEVDCREIFQPGQLGVAIGRVRNVKGLRVINFSSKVCFPQPEAIHKFQSEPPLAVLNDLSCCRISHRVETVDIVDPFWFEEEFEEEQEEDFDEEFDKVISNLDLVDTQNIQIPEDYNLVNVLKECMIESPVNDIQREVNDIIGKILAGELENTKKFCSQQFMEFTKIANEMNIIENVGVKAEKLNEFYTECHKHQTSDSYKLACILFLQNFSETSHAHSYVCTKITSSVRQYVLNQKTKLLSASGRDISDRHITSASKARIRYVGGYCVHQVKKKYNSIHKSMMYSRSVEGQASFQIAEERMAILNSVIDREENIKIITTEPQSLIDIERRQFLSHGLLNINDDMYNFFCKACDLSIKYLIDKNFNVHGEQLHTFCLNKIQNDPALFENFAHIIGTNIQHFDSFSSTESLPSDDSVVNFVINKMVSNAQHTIDLYKEIVEKFLLVMLSQFRKDLLESFSVAKTMAHRKQIQVRKEKQDLATKSVSFNTILSDKTPQKEMSHSLLKGMLLGNSDIFKPFTKKQICQLCKAYNVSVKSTELKSLLSQKLRTAILSSNYMSNYKVLVSEADSESSSQQDIQEPTTSTAGASSEIDQDSQTPELAASGTCETNPQDTDSDLCKKCQMAEKEGEQWIQCSSCSNWFHRHCAGLKSKYKWKKFSKEGVDFYCNECA